MKILEGKTIATRIRAEVSDGVDRLRQAGIVPRMTVVMSKANPGIVSYVNTKKKAASALGIQLETIELAENSSQRELEQAIELLARDPLVHGIMIESPLAKGLDYMRALELVPSVKDVDGLTPANLGRVTAGREDNAIAAATPLACVSLIESHTSLAGKRVAIVGRGRTVGRPLIGLLLNRDATPTICHTKTPGLASVLAECDVIIVAIGRAHSIGCDFLRSGHIVIDAGINVEGTTVVGDVDFNSVSECGIEAMTPVPGGVGPVTTAMIFRNLIRAIELQSIADVRS